jgi:hypothetical protein
MRLNSPLGFPFCRDRDEKFVDETLKLAIAAEPVRYESPKRSRQFAHKLPFSLLSFSPVTCGEPLS